ncbi:transposable element Tcb2 transposase [Trichonephila clavipes]|nr:transposable element Tcb2 transposase [Trichonephila clavipes]
MWNVTDWQKVVFSDESFFVLGTDDNLVRVWRSPALDRFNVYRCPTRRVFSGTGLVTRQATVRYLYHSATVATRPHVGHFLNGLPGAIFQQDNARPHTARVPQDFLRHFQTLPWPASAPNLSPVEHGWDQLKQQMPSCHSVHHLELVIQDLWAHVPQDNIRCLINSMPDRVAACFEVGGGPTRY